jgi:GDP-4-dehydro-6-deoxy-D-mannose reductase
LRVLITGISGFIGSHVAELSLRKGDAVIGATHSSWHSDAPHQLVEAVDLLRWDIRNPAPDRVVRRVDEFRPEVVYHFAAISIPTLCGREKPTQRALAVNLRGTSHMLDLVQSLSTNPRVIFASTSHVYDRVDRSSPIVTEIAPLQPVSAYGQTKLRCEQEIQRRIRESRLDGCIVRGFHHIGPRQPAGLMLTEWLEQLQNPDTTELRVRCTNSYLDLVDVRDAALAYRLLASKGSAGDIYNLGSGRISKSGDVLRVILSQSTREITVIEQSAKEQWNAIADISKLSSLGWEPQTEYTDTIYDMMSVDNES